jgi:hypothetical protein
MILCSWIKTAILCCIFLKIDRSNPQISPIHYLLKVAAAEAAATNVHNKAQIWWVGQFPQQWGGTI